MYLVFTSSRFNSLRIFIIYEIGGWTHISSPVIFQHAKLGIQGFVELFIDVV